MKCLVSIVNWNVSDDTNRCLTGIAELPKADQPDVVVVDNGSKQDILNIRAGVKSQLRSLEVIKNQTNLGFAGGHNPNIRKAKSEGYDYIFLLNPDTEIIDKEMFKKLTAALEKNIKALGANPTILSSLDPNIIWYGGGKLSIVTGRASHLRTGQIEKGGGEIKRVSYLTGCCLAINLKRAALDQLLLTEDYFVYWEDTDWSARAAKAGFDLLYVPKARLLHYVSSALGTRSPVYIYYNIRNHFLFARRNIRGLYRPLAWLGIDIIALRYKANILLRYKGGRWEAFKALWLGWIDGLRGGTGKMPRDI